MGAFTCGVTARLPDQPRVDRTPSGTTFALVQLAGLFYRRSHQWLFRWNFKFEMKSLLQRCWETASGVKAAIGGPGWIIAMQAERTLPS